MPDTSVVAPNSLVLISDPQHPSDIPTTMSGDVVSATESCIAVGTLEESEGPVRISLVDAATADVSELPALEVADIFLKTSSREVAVSSVLGELYLRLRTETDAVRVRVFVNHSTEPDDIGIIVG